MKNLGKVPIQQKKSTSQYQWKSYESTLMLDPPPFFFFCVDMGSKMMYVKVFE